MNMKNDHHLSAEGYALVGVGYEVYNEQGFGLAEEIYQECMEIELGLMNIPFSAKPNLKVYYKGHRLNKTYIPDLHVFGKIILELKSVKELTSEHEGQLMNYMRITLTAVGYLMNFGQPQGLQWKRFIISEYIPEDRNKNDRLE